MQKTKALAFSALIVLLVAAVQPAIASDWVKMGEAPNGMEFFIDRDSVTTEVYGNTSVWVKRANPDGSFSLILDSFDLYNRSTYDVLFTYDYDSRGMITKEDANSYTHYIVPDSIAETIYMTLKTWSDQ